MTPPAQQQLFDDDPLPWELAAEEDVECAEVVFNRPMEQAFSYLVPEAWRGKLRAGQRVRCPFGRGNRPLTGYCVGFSRPKNTGKLKSLLEVIDREPLLNQHMLDLTQWIGERYLCSWGQALNTIIPAGVKNYAGTRMRTYFSIDEEALARVGETNLPAKQAAVIAALRAAKEPLQSKEIEQSADCGSGPVNGLKNKGILRVTRRRAATSPPSTDAVEREQDLTLNPEQLTALEKILQPLRSQKHETLLLHGVTGSGKTEVYIQAIREVVSYGRQAIVLVPEISLTPQTIRRFESRFNSVAVLHSHLTDAERHRQWKLISSGNVQVVVGARSAVFAPTTHLGLIVIDEEHETTFKQETTPRYHAREVARQRAKMAGIPLILGSATPTLESYARARRGIDQLITLKKRVSDLPLPPVSAVDVRNDPRCVSGSGIGRAIQTAIRAAVEDGGQVILFLNVRGHSPVLWCKACGEGIKCPNCDITLTWHKDRHLAMCHTCEFAIDPPKTCPRCGHAAVRYFGIGTQRLEEEVAAKFPRYKCLRMDSDTMRKRGSYETALDAFRKGEVQILLGTQMIAKGLDFPNVTLVGVIDADTILHQPDIRAAERTFQLIAQVAGRAGRSSKGGRVLVQTSSPDEPAIQFATAHDYVGFVHAEIQHRREMQAPPFWHLARVILRGLIDDEVVEFANSMATVLRKAAEESDLPVRLLGPAPAPIMKLNKFYRHHFQLAAEQAETIQKLWRSVATKLPKSSNVEYVVDVDPLNMR
ncbi:Primosomal protein N' [Symmachiella dynata]|uniref:replication restart helicase PriA n=1 Tax=Symmachiella dynata TaxID=2527995 RepID=UPI00118A3DAC|nr:primosomal protein N' [Symmachiella dynata]QDT50212.1 Primosomal protein N' [Symmachiella dynata]